MTKIRWRNEWRSHMFWNFIWLHPSHCCRQKKNEKLNDSWMAWLATTAAEGKEEISFRFYCRIDFPFAARLESKGSFVNFYSLLQTFHYKAQFYIHHYLKFQLNRNCCFWLLFSWRYRDLWVNSTLVNEKSFTITLKLLKIKFYFAWSGLQWRLELWDFNFETNREMKHWKSSQEFIKLDVIDNIITSCTKLKTSFRQCLMT